MLLLISGSVLADDVKVLAALLKQVDNTHWDVSVTLRHQDTGWEHYADAWRVVLEDGTVLATRTLFHPHENEQPFTRSLSGVVIGPSVRVVFVQAHDKQHGWSSKHLRVDIPQTHDGRVEVRL